METKARKRYVRISPKKLKKVADFLKGKDVEEAMKALPFLPQRGAKVIHKTLKSAVSNALNLEGFDFNEEDLYIKHILVERGPILHRYRAGALGRAKRIRHRLSHLTIILDEKSSK